MWFCTLSSCKVIFMRIYLLQYSLFPSVKGFPLSCRYYGDLDDKKLSHISLPLWADNKTTAPQILHLLLPDVKSQTQLPQQSINNYEPVLVVIYINFHSFHAINIFFFSAKMYCGCIMNVVKCDSLVLKQLLHILRKSTPMCY